jgi:hypothetical protein
MAHRLVAKTSLMLADVDEKSTWVQRRGRLGI